MRDTSTRAIESDVVSKKERLQRRHDAATPHSPSGEIGETPSESPISCFARYGYRDVSKGTSEFR